MVLSEALSVLAVSVAISATAAAPFGYNTSPHSLASTSRREVELVCTDEEKEWVYKPDNMNRDCGPTCKNIACQETNVSCGDYGEVTEERCGLIVDPKDQQSGEYDDQRCGVFHCCPTGPECMRRWSSPFDRSPVVLK